MLPKSSEQPLSPRIKANPLSCLFFTWLIPLFVKGYSKDLTFTDIYQTLPEDETKKLADKMEAAWLAQVAKAEKRNKGRKEGGDRKKYKPSLIKALTSVFGCRIGLYAIFAILEETVLKILQPLILGNLLDYCNNPKHFGPYDGYMYGGGVILLTMLYQGCDHPYTFAVQHLGMKMRISLTTLIYRKALRISKYAMEQTPAGQITNFLSSDMNRFDLFFSFFHYLWVAPMQLVSVIAVLYFHAELGYASFAGLILLFVFMPFQMYMGHMFSKLRKETVKKTDERLLGLEEILTAIRVIKMYTWEGPFSEQVSESRKAEIVKLKKTAMCRALNESLFYVTSRTTLFITLLVYILCGHTLTAKKVYVTLSLYQSVQMVMTLFFPNGIISTAETLVAISRIRKFLLMPEKEKPTEPVNERILERVRKYDWAVVASDETSISSQYTYTTASFDTTHSEVGVWARDISAQWNPQMKELSFCKVTFELKSGEVMAIIGPTASGKSSILNSLLYELPVKSGEFRTVGKVAYSSQEPWVFNGSVRDNILFGKPYNATWYDEVTSACALTRDFQLLGYGDRTLVGEKGSELSGGQKARVTLARAVYADADIYLLDDPLSAVDAQVGRHIVENCILGLLKNKCRILVTHQLQHVKLVDKVLVMVDGYVAHMGDYKSLQASGIPFSELLSLPHEMKVHENRSTNSLRGAESTTSALLGMASDKAPNLDTASPTKVRDTVLESPEEEDEFMARGALSLQTFYKYFHAGNSFGWILFMLTLMILTQCLFTGTDLWIQYWVALETKLGAGTLEYSDGFITRAIQENQLVRIGIYTFLTVSLFLVVLARTQMFFSACMRSSVVIYERLFQGVIRSPISFFERTPIGRVLNRFAKDVSIIDEYFPQSMYDVTDVFAQAIGIFVLVSINTRVMIIPAIILLFIMYFLRKFYFRSAINIKRLEGVARSPIFNHLSTSLMGLSTIRSFEVEQRFVEYFEEVHNLHTSCWYAFLCGTRWLGITVDWIVIVFLSGLVFNFLSNMDSAGDSVVGVTLTSGMMLTMSLQWGMRQAAEMENHLIAFERVSEYCVMPSEAELESKPDKKPPPTWPAFGEIRIRNICLRYAENNNTTVLKNVTCTINAGEKLGIVGRTGAGKSSLINVLFRLAEPTSGYIEIDGVETTSIGLHDLRGKISIIPQEPLIFGGTVRTNLDPFFEHTDAELWNALQEVHLTEAVKLLGGGLDSEMNEGGSNFSLGQKQLFCLARCILKRNRILVLDEATASVDPETDRLIQKTIRKNFAECTILTIAHRLHTVMDSDRILVLNAGQILEMDEPQILLSNRQSMLYNLVQQTGKAEASNLAHIAKLAALRRRQLKESKSSDSTGYSRSINTNGDGELP